MEDILNMYWTILLDIVGLSGQKSLIGLKKNRDDDLMGNNTGKPAMAISLLGSAGSPTGEAWPKICKFVAICYRKACFFSFYRGFYHQISSFPVWCFLLHQSTEPAFLADADAGVHPILRVAQGGAMRSDIWDLSQSKTASIYLPIKSNN